MENNNYAVSYVLQELAKDTITETSKVFKRGDRVSEKMLMEHSAKLALTFERTVSSATKTRKIRLSSRNRCLLEALEVNTGENIKIDREVMMERTLRGG